MKKIDKKNDNISRSFHDDWLPSGKEVEQWLKELKSYVQNKKGKKALNPVIMEFKQLIDHDPIVRMYITKMIAQIPKKYHHHHIKSVDHLLQLLNHVLTIAPEYKRNALVGTPLSAVLIWTMGTSAGFAAYRNEKINLMFKKILVEWCKFLNSEKSLYVLNDTKNGWKCDSALQNLQMQNYIHNPKDKYWGFKSWNDFFTRKLAKGVRPIEQPKNNKIIVSACDSTVYKISHDVQKYSEFWIKSQSYSLNDILANDEFVDQFVGGSVYQAFLNPFNYHRWHSPVSGTIKKAYVKEGLYFSQADSEGEDPTDQDLSEAYIAQVQTRAIIFIECDDPAIGLMCVVPVGMVEISTCVINSKIKAGHKVKKGDELGYFQFGGSTHCLIFRPGVIKKFTALKNQFYEVGQEIGVAN